MTQRKLTDAERIHAWEARLHIQQMYSADGMPDNGHWFKQHLLLSQMLDNGTTDGRPYVEPTPEIGEGYRLATEADRDRRDRDMCDVHGKWVPAHVGIHAGNYTYRVPVDRVPTDEDAIGRPTVMVRDYELDPWMKTRLIAVAESDDGSFWEKSFHTVTCWKHCRFPYPGELE